MLRKTVVMCSLIILVFTFAGAVQAQENVQEFFNDVATKVKAVDDPAEKRDILETELERMSEALSRVQMSPLVPGGDKEGLKRLQANIQEKKDELAGENGFGGVPATQLNNFADYIVQDMEQADRTVTMSIVTLLLLIIVVALLA